MYGRDWNNVKVLQSRGKCGGADSWCCYKCMRCSRRKLASYVRVYVEDVCYLEHNPSMPDSDSDKSRCMCVRFEYGTMYIRLLLLLLPARINLIVQ